MGNAPLNAAHSSNTGVGQKEPKEYLQSDLATYILDREDSQLNSSSRFIKTFRCKVHDNRVIVKVYLANDSNEDDQNFVQMQQKKLLVLILCSAKTRILGYPELMLQSSVRNDFWTV